MTPTTLRMVLLAVPLLIALLLPARAAHADTVRDEAHAHALLGRAAFDKKDYRTARTEYRRAYELAPIPDLLFNIGRCDEELGDPAAAADSFTRYLAARQDAPERAELERHVTELRARSPRATPPPEPTARPATPPLQEPGTNALTATAPPPRTPVYRRWWLWTTVGVVAVGVGLGVGLGLGLKPSAPALDFPAVTLR